MCNDTRSVPVPVAGAPITAAVPDPARITIVEADACHFCEDAHQVLAGLVERWPLEVETVDVRSRVGQRLMARHRAGMSPLLLVDDEFFSQGRLPARKLAQLLSSRFGDRPPTAPGSAESSHG